jgi:flagellar motor switch protein FliM
MSEILSADRIAALVEAARQGHVPEQSAGTPRRGRMRTVDFSRPTKFTSDHQRRISRGIDTFCQTVATRLSAELRWPIELEAINTAQLTWSAAHSQLPPGSLAVTIEIQPLGTRMLLTAEQSFVLTGLECLLGGSPDRPPRERRLSEIDWTLTRRMIDSIVHQLSLVWQDLGAVALVAGDIDVHNDSSQIAPVSEPTFVVMIESRINKQSSALALLIPWAAIEQISDRISGREKRGTTEDQHGASAIALAVSRAPITLRAEVASVDMPVEQILALGPQSVVKLGGRADNGISLFAENVKLGRAQPGCNGAKRAVQIRGPQVEQP